MNLGLFLMSTTNKRSQNNLFCFKTAPAKSEMQNCRTAICQPDKIIGGWQKKSNGFCKMQRREHLLNLIPKDQTIMFEDRQMSRVEDKTFICSRRREDAGPHNNWMSPDR
jgi:GTP-dependent phosphoenolpyruvate carboxykinase